MPISFYCPHCGKLMVIKHLKPGEVAQCKTPYCGALVVVPSESGGKAEFAPEYEGSRVDSSHHFRFRDKPSGIEVNHRPPKSGEQIERLKKKGYKMCDSCFKWFPAKSLKQCRYCRGWYCPEHWKPYKDDYCSIHCYSDVMDR